MNNKILRKKKVQFHRECYYAAQKLKNTPGYSIFIQFSLNLNWNIAVTSSWRKNGAKEGTFYLMPMPFLLVSFHPEVYG